VGCLQASNRLTTCDAFHCLLELCDGLILEVRLHRRKIRSASLCDCMYRMVCIWHRVVAVDTALDKSSSADMHSVLTSLIIGIKLTLVIIKLKFVVIKLMLVVFKLTLT